MNTKYRSIVLAMAIAAVVLVAAVGSASAGCIDQVTGYDYQCGETVVHSCTFDADLTCPAGAPGLYVGAEGITIDGAGHTMTGNRGAAGACDIDILWGVIPPNDVNPAMHSGIANSGSTTAGNWNKVVIKNLTIKEFCTGIALGDMHHTDVDFNEVTDCTIYDCGDPDQSTHGIHMVQTNYSTITENIIYNIEGPGHPAGCSAGGNGIFMYGNMDTDDGWNNSVTHNNLSYNNKSGFFMKHMCMYNNVSYNNATENRQGGITLRCLHSSFNDVMYNNATGNDIWGIYIGGYNNSVYNNTANETGYGIIATDEEGVGICLCRGMSDNNDIHNNTVCWNEGHGIRIIQDATGNTLHDNYVCFNGQVTGVDIKDLDATTGDDNRCDRTIGYNDTSANFPPYPCVDQCPCDGTNLVIIDKTEKWYSEYTSYTINYTICNLGEVASNASWTEIYINGTSTGVVDGPINAINPGACADERTVGPFDSYGPDDTIRLWADYNDTTEDECYETDNNRTNVFGGADLVIEDFDHVWTNLSWKTYDVTYTVRNVGDRPTPVSCEVNFTDNNGDDWKDCVDPDDIPAGLPVGPPVGPRTRTFVMGDSNDWIQVWVNFNHTCPVKVWGVLQHDFDRRGVLYPSGGPCWDINNNIATCGDVNCDAAIDVFDSTKVTKRAGNPSYYLRCLWAADAKCDGDIDVFDSTKVTKRAGNPGYVLNCCKGCDLW